MTRAQSLKVVVPAAFILLLLVIIAGPSHFKARKTVQANTFAADEQLASTMLEYRTATIFRMVEQNRLALRANHDLAFSRKATALFGELDAHHQEQSAASRVQAVLGRPPYVSKEGDYLYPYVDATDSSLHYLVIKFSGGTVHMVQDKRDGGERVWVSFDD